MAGAASETASAPKPVPCPVASMTDSAIAQVCWLASRLALATLILMAIGSATRVMNAGLACPDWPLCYGQLLPRQQMNLQVFLEWFHRLDASVVGLGALAMLGLSLVRRSQLPGWVPWAAVAAVVLVLTQGLLGALTVTELLRFDLVTAHLGTALLFFSTLLAIALCLRPYQPLGTAGPLVWVAPVALVLVYGQSLLGGIVASRWALHQCLAGSQLCQIMNSHLLGVLPVSIAVLSVAWVAWHRPAIAPILRKLSLAGIVALGLQASLGTAALKLRLQVEPLTVAHQTVGALLLALMLAISVIAWRDRTQAPFETQARNSQTHDAFPSQT